MSHVARSRRWHLAWFPLLAMGASHCLAQQIVVSPGKPDAVYDVGEKVTWDVAVRGAHPEQVKTAHFLLKRDGFTKLSDGDIDLSTGHATLQTSIDGPGTVLAIVTTDVPSGVAAEAGKPQRVLGGAAVDPGHMNPLLPGPPTSTPSGLSRSKGSTRSPRIPNSLWARIWTPACGTGSW